MSTFVTEEIVRYVTASGGENAAVRDSLRLPAARARDVQLIAIDSLCAVAAAAYAQDRRGRGAGLSGSVFVAKVKRVYVVYDPEYDNAPIVGQPRASVSIVFDANWQPLARY